MNVNNLDAIYEKEIQYDRDLKAKFESRFSAHGPVALLIGEYAKILNGSKFFLVESVAVKEMTFM